MFTSDYYRSILDYILFYPDGFVLSVVCAQLSDSCRYHDADVAANEITDASVHPALKTKQAESVVLPFV